MSLATAPDYAQAVEAVRADLIEAAKITGAFTVGTGADQTRADGQDGGAEAAPVRVIAVELGQAPAKPAKG